MLVDAILGVIENPPFSSTPQKEARPHAARSNNATSGLYIL